MSTCWRWPTRRYSKPASGSHQGLLAYNWIKATLPGELGHVGEIEALVAMRARLGAASET